MKERSREEREGRGWERSWSGKAISRRTVWSRSVYWLNDKYFGGKEKRVKLKKSRVFRMKQQDSGDLSHTDIHSHLYLEKLVHAMLRKQWMFSEGESYKCKNISRNKYCKKFSVLSVDLQTVRMNISSIPNCRLSKDFDALLDQNDIEHLR